MTLHGVADPLLTQLSNDGLEDAVEIGRGGFGIVYRCRQVRLDRLVAVKVLTIDLDENRDRFEREQRAMAKLTGHPNILAVLQVGDTFGGYPYLVMPYCRRGSIHAKIDRQGRLALEESLHLGVALSAALESGHRLGIIHRDVKPANVLITDYGEPALTDFGIAHIPGGFVTATGLLAASPSYTAPEVIRGDPSDLATDVYSLGATLFCALTGDPPFKRRAGETVMAQLLRTATSQPPDLRDFGIDEDVAEVVNRAISPQPELRPTMPEFGERLQELQSARGLSVGTMTLPGGDEPTKPPVRLAQSNSQRQTRGNLPAPLAGFVGRESEFASLDEMISTSRLVTVLGVGGVGKTALALEAARKQAPNFQHGIWLIDVSELSDGSALTRVAAGTLGIRDQGRRPLIDELVDHFAEREALLVIDNCEQVIDAVADLIDRLLRGCVKLRILATSREVLGLGGELLMPLSPLPYPEVDAATPVADLAQYDAVALFLERARTAQPGFALTQRDAAYIASICSRLDGLPLAIELAAARLRAMTVKQIAERLSSRFTFLTRGKRGAPTRQQTLRYCIDWSYDRCTGMEQKVWARLSVFAGSFDLAAARDICIEDMDTDDLLDELCALVDKSILTRIEEDGVVRFRLLTTLREYGKSRIPADEYQRLQRSHFDWYQQLVTKAYAEWFSGHQVAWTRRLKWELPNIQQALQFGLSDSPAKVGRIAAISFLLRANSERS